MYEIFSKIFYQYTMEGRKRTGRACKRWNDQSWAEACRRNILIRLVVEVDDDTYHYVGLSEPWTQLFVEDKRNISPFAEYQKRRQSARAGTVISYSVVKYKRARVATAPPPTPNPLCKIAHSKLLHLVPNSAVCPSTLPCLVSTPFRKLDTRMLHRCCTQGVSTTVPTVGVIYRQSHSRLCESLCTESREDLHFKIGNDSHIACVNLIRHPVMRIK
jgi:hypothetical protein